MDKSVGELGLTLLSGAFVILGIDAIIFYIWKRPGTGFFQGSLGFRKGTDDNASQSPVSTLLFIGLSFFVGSAIESYSYMFFEEFPLVNKHETRLSVLFSRDGRRPSSLAKELIENNLFVKIDPVNGKSTQDWILSESPHNKIETICEIQKSSIMKLFYYSKNIVYKDQNHFKELYPIQKNIMFCGMIGFFSFILIFAAIQSAVVLSISELLKKSKLSRSLGDKTEFSIKENSTSIIVTTILLVLNLSFVKADSNCTQLFVETIQYLSTAVQRLSSDYFSLYFAVSTVLFGIFLFVSSKLHKNSNCFSEIVKNLSKCIIFYCILLHIGLIGYRWQCQEFSKRVFGYYVSGYTERLLNPQANKSIKN